MVLRAQRQIRSDGIVPLLHAYLNNDPPVPGVPLHRGRHAGRAARRVPRIEPARSRPTQAQRIIQRIAEIVGPAHRATPRLIHRDLKPSNVMVERKADGKVVLRVTDFGIGAIAAAAGPGTIPLRVVARGEPVVGADGVVFPALRLAAADAAATSRTRGTTCMPSG